ncbi:glycosyltransferase WbuB [Bacteroidia bacterium]|nr:glycosyltransferase WbuB [Bacteroidia bacterium]
MKNKSKKIVFINQSSGYLMVDIVNAFAQSGNYDEVALISGEIKNKETISPKIQLSFIKKYTKKNTIDRTLSWVIATIQSLFWVLFKYRGYHIFLSSNPPTISFITSFLSNAYSVLIYDLYPEGLVKGKFVSEKSVINKWWSKYNNKFFKKADHVFAITDGIAKEIKRYSPLCNVNVIPVWYESMKKTSGLSTENLFVKKHHLENKFIILYSGNMGKGHDLESLVYLANQFKNEKDMVFVFSGEGWKKQIINDLITELKLENCLVLSYQSKDLFLDCLSSAHIGVVSVTKGAELVCIPSKTYNLLSFGIPILGIAEDFSDLSHLINENQVGKCFTSEDINGMTKYVRSIKEKEGTDYRENALQTSKKYTSDNAFRFLDYLHA